MLHALCMRFNEIENLRPTIKSPLPLGDCYLQQPLHASTQTPETLTPSQRSRKPHSRSESCIAGWPNAAVIHAFTAEHRLYQEKNELLFLSKGTTGYQLRAGWACCSSHGHRVWSSPGWSAKALLTGMLCFRGFLPLLLPFLRFPLTSSCS